FIDSAGLGALIGGQRQARTFRGSFTLVAPSAPVSRLFELTSLDRVFQIVDHVNDVPVPSVPAT
ncbi:MAG: STAS domain-containing protein, partial [Microbacterium sp.]